MGKDKEKISLKDQQMLEFAMQSSDDIQRELNSRSLFEFLIWAWPAYSAQPFIANWHIKYLCKELEKVAYRVGERKPKKHDLLINISPGTTKTALCSIMFPIWCWTKWPWMRFICASYAKDLSLESAEYSRDIVRSKLFASVYPEIQVKADKESKGNFRIVVKTDNITGNKSKSKKEIKGGGRFSTSVGAVITGFHGDINIWDDPLKPDEAASPKQLETVNRWIDETLPTRKTDKAISATIGIMQRLNENDPSGHLLAKKKKKLKHICLPGEARHYKKFIKPKRLIKKYKNGLFDKYRMSQEVLDELEADLGQYGYAGQIGQNPAPPGGGLFQVSAFPIKTDLIDPRQIQKSVRYWDKAGTVNDGAYTVGILMHRLKNKMFVVADVKRGQWRSEVRERMIRQTAIADGMNVDICVEQEPGSGGKESAEGTILNLAGFKVSAERPTGDKEKRADRYSVQVNNGNVILMAGEWVKEYKEEHSMFPFGKYKDQVDGSTGAFNYLLRKKLVKRLTA